jgi:hypothetical protein
MEKIPYVLCYPDKSLKSEYLMRFIERGNTECFIEIFIGRWGNFINSFENDISALKHIVLKSGQYLSDVVDDLIFV